MIISDLKYVSDRFKRSENQDKYVVLRGINSSIHGGEVAIFAVFDGISNSNGYQSSIIAANHAHTQLCQVMSQLYKGTEDEYDEYVPKMLKKIILDIDKKLCDQCFTNTSTGFEVKFGTTVSIAVLCENRLYTANAGDSPIFLADLSDRSEIKLKEVYTCHNKAGEKLRQGEIASEQEATPDDKRRLMRYAGYGLEESDIATYITELPSLSMLLVGSDGALSVINKNELTELTQSSLSFASSASKLGADLFRKVYDETQSTDNFTLISALIRRTKE